MNEEDMINEIDFCLAGEYITMEHRQAIEGLLKRYNQEKEKNKKLEEELDEAIINAYFNKEEVCNKVIDRMAKQISCLSRNLDNATNFERVSEEEYNVDFIKQYYFKKARGEKDE